MSYCVARGCTLLLGHHTKMPANVRDSCGVSIIVVLYKQLKLAA